MGAGPAGGMAASLLSERGWRVLMVDRFHFPRDKTCGGCVNAAGVSVLREAGLLAVLAGGQLLDQFDLNVMGQRISVPLPRSYSIARSELDHRLAIEARTRGCKFAQGVSAVLLPGGDSDKFRQLKLRSGKEEAVVSAGVVLACDGINGALLDGEPGAGWVIARDAWFGASLTLDAGVISPRRGAIEMNVGNGGYAGLVQLGDGRVHIGAALESARCQAVGGPVQLIELILKQCKRDFGGLINAAKLHGTGRLTRKRNKLGGRRVLAVGDACGYIEPFTGEGIAWALGAAKAVADLLPWRGTDWPAGLADFWTKSHGATIGRRQWMCRALRQIARRPELAAGGVAVARMFPAIPAGVARTIGRPAARFSERVEGVFS